MQPVEVVADARLTYAPVPHEVHALVPVLSELYMPTEHEVQTIEEVAAARLPNLPDVHAVQATDVDAPEMAL